MKQPMIGGDVVVHNDAAGRLRSMSKTLASPLPLDVKPSIAGAVAENRGSAAFAGKRESSRAELVIHARVGPAKRSSAATASPTTAAAAIRVCTGVAASLPANSTQPGTTVVFA